MKRTTIPSAALALALVVTFGGCGNNGESDSGAGTATGTATAEAPRFSESEADTTVEATLQDFAFVGIPPTVKGPKVFFRASNKGPAEHELEVLDASGEPLGEIGAMPPGESAALAIELPPGTYTLQCLVEEGGKPHTELGMKTTLRVT